MKWYLLHPMVVHFPIALLTTGFLAEAARVLFKKRDNITEAAPHLPWLQDAASWLLWLGTVSALAAIGLGLLAAKTAPHVPEAWETLIAHRNAAYAAGFLFSLLSAWRFFPRPKPGLFLAGWLVCLGAIFYAAYHGGELVYRYGMGTAPSAE
jgi:uncharacterized membrane protein